MKTVVDQIARAAKTLSEATEKALDSAEREAGVHRGQERRRRVAGAPVGTGDRRHGHLRELFALREELEDVKLRVSHNARQLEIQFARLAEMQMELNRITGKKPPRFRG